MKKFKTREQRAAHYRNLCHRTDKTARRGRAALDREQRRIEASGLPRQALGSPAHASNEARP